jgi:hypothetical protein
MARRVFNVPLHGAFSHERLSNDLRLFNSPTLPCYQ